jgi:hypothetical protein
MPSMRASGEITRRMERESFFMLMVIYMMENGRMTKLMDMGSIYTQMGRVIRENGNKTYNMDLALKLGLMEVNFKDIIVKAKNKEKASTLGKMAAITRGIGKTTK